MRAVAILVTLAVVLSLVLADPPIPQTPDQFVADVKITLSGIFPTTVSGKYYYDFPNQRERIDEVQFGTSVTTLNLYQTGFSYQYAMGQCKCTALTDPMNPSDVPYGSVYKGYANINGQQCAVWEWDSPFVSNLVTSTYYVNANEEVARANWTTSMPGMTTTMLMDFSNIVDGAPGDAAFAVPNYCAGKCPSPPAPYVPGGSCPGNPDQACQCLPQSQLSFCTGVNYPVSNLIQASVVDQLAQAAYNLAILAIPSPSTSCLANFKAFMCATFFPTCIGTTLPIIFLPCPDLCPFCGCGMGAGNCTSASSPTACTSYGTTNYCN